MASKIKPKRSFTTGAVPTTSDLDTNEVAINWADGKAYTKNAAGNIVSVTLGGGSSSIVTDSTVSGFPATGTAGVLYVALDTARTYEWQGAYLEIGAAGGIDTVARSLLVPPSPTAITGTAGTGSVALSWSAANLLPTITNTDYTVQYSSDSGSTWTAFSRSASTATSATVSGLSGITTTAGYAFRIGSVNAAGTSAYVSDTTPSGFGGTFSSASYAAGPAHSRGASAFLGAVALSTGSVVLVPYSSSTIGLFDPVAGTYSSGPSHGASSPAFAGGVLATNGKVILVPNSTYIGIYDPTANTYTSGPSHGQGTSAFYGGVALPSGKIAMLPHNSTAIGIYDPVANTYANGPTHSQGNGAFVGGVLMLNGKVCVVPFSSANVGIYDPAANTYTNGPAATSFFGGVMLASGKAVLCPLGASNVGVVTPSPLVSTTSDIATGSYLNKF